MSWEIIYPANQAGAREALAHSLAGRPGFESEASADGSLYTLGRAVLIRPGSAGFEVVFGLSASGLERRAVVMRHNLDPEKACAGSVVHVVPYTRLSLGIAAWLALDCANKAERSEYAAFFPLD